MRARIIKRGKGDFVKSQFVEKVDRLLRKEKRDWWFKDADLGAFRSSISAI